MGYTAASIDRALATGDATKLVISWGDAPGGLGRGIGHRVSHTSRGAMVSHWQAQAHPSPAKRAAAVEACRVQEDHWEDYSWCLNGPGCADRYCRDHAEGRGSDDTD